MKIQLVLATVFLLGTAVSGRAQSAGDPETPDTNEMVPQLPDLVEPEQTPRVEENVVPMGESGAPATGANDAAVDANQPGFQRDVVPQSTRPERAEDEVNPDVIPDRRFETFDNDTQGTPEMEPMPQSDDSAGGTIGLPPGGYGIGGPGR